MIITSVLDLYCKAGGAAMGYRQALPNVEIVGVDIEPQPRYPFQFVQDDALDYATAHGDSFDLIHASPPCQVYSVTSPLSAEGHVDLIADTRQLLQAIGTPYVIENVPGAPLENPLMLCGTMFGLRVIRHRLFEIWPNPIWFAPHVCNHNGRATGADASQRRGGTKTPGFADGFAFITVCGHSFLVDDAKVAMGIDWMIGDELAQAVPPAYTQWIGQQLSRQ